MKSWAGVGEAYAASYAALCAGTGDRMREMLGEPRARSLLDVGSGDGTLAAAWMDAGWRVTACEPEPTMRIASARQHPSLEVVDGALPRLPFADGEFDVVVANFVLNHVADPRVSAGELGRVSRGTVLATVWTQSPSWLWTEVIARAELEPAVSARLPVSQDFERTADGLGRMLGEAGFPDVSVNELTWTWNADPTALWVSVEGGVAGAGAYFAALGHADRVAFRAAFDAVVEERGQGGTLPLEHRAAIAMCTAS